MNPDWGLDSRDKRPTAWPVIYTIDPFYILDPTLKDTDSHGKKL